VHVQVRQLNVLRAPPSVLQPGACRRVSKVAGGISGAVHSAADLNAETAHDGCRFDLLPTHERQTQGSCEDAPGVDCSQHLERCFQHSFADEMPTCAKSCGFCGRCIDTSPECSAWAASGACLDNAEYMAKTCPDVCSYCEQTYTQQPPHWVALWNGLLMPTVGLGTAGLGTGAAAAVEQALRVGYRMLDSAQAREWYREDLNGKARSFSLVARAWALYSHCNLYTPAHKRAFACFDRLALRTAKMPCSGSGGQRRTKGRGVHHHQDPPPAPWQAGHPRCVPDLVDRLWNRLHRPGAAALPGVLGLAL
jgi:ShK domain-like